MKQLSPCYWFMLVAEATAWAVVLSVVPTPIIFPGFLFMGAWLAWFVRARKVFLLHSHRRAFIWLLVFLGAVSIAFLAPFKASDTMFRFPKEARVQLQQLPGMLESQGFRVIVVSQLPSVTLPLPSSEVSYRTLRHLLNDRGFELVFFGRCGNATRWSILFGTRTDTPKHLALHPYPSLQ